MYSTTPVIFGLGAMYTFGRGSIGPLHLYLIGLVSVVGGIAATLIAKEVPPGDVSDDYMQKLYGEGVAVIWPYTFAFTLLFLASPFVAQSTANWLTEIRTVVATIVVSALGFVALIILPMSSVAEIRRELARREARRSSKAA